MPVRPNPVLSLENYDFADEDTEATLLTSQEELRRFSSHLAAAREEERRHIAREIHDELGQLLTALKMDVSLLEMRPSSDLFARKKLGEMRGLVERAIVTVRHVANHLRPAALNYGIVPALQWLTNTFSQRNSGAVCRLQVQGPDPSLDNEQATTIFRIAQESLTNVARHAGATEVKVTLSSTADAVALEISDNGCGFDMAGLPDCSFGLMGMKERACTLGAKLQVRSAQNAGTTISIVISRKQEFDPRRQAVQEVF
ncbi:sensor histidine kinase [Cupriavidus necator]|uniref:Sensor histidine kinase n=2 Tax=Cupriavidus necator TaxID=106590 RepID=A0A367PIN4_CUPNE|nr:sensor histidine kinase [Cupriavidus necator]RCJ06856.1 sensor histidine kinase [Cupriavidus necator]